MQRPGSHVLFSVWSLSLVVGPAKVPHPLLTSQVLDRLRLGWVSVSLRRRKEGVVWPNAAAGSTTNQIQGRVMLLKNLLPVLLLALQTQPKPCERCAMKIYFTKTVPFTRLWLWHLLWQWSQCRISHCLGSRLHGSSPGGLLLWLPGAQPKITFSGLPLGRCHGLL